MVFLTCHISYKQTTDQMDFTHNVKKEISFNYVQMCLYDSCDYNKNNTTLIYLSNVQLIGNVQQHFLLP